MEMDPIKFAEDTCGMLLSSLAYKITHTKTCVNPTLRLEQVGRIKIDLEKMLTLLDSLEDFCDLSILTHTTLSTDLTGCLVQDLEETCALLPNDTRHKQGLLVAKECHQATSRDMAEFEIDMKQEVSDRFGTLKRMFQAQLSEVALII